VSFTWLIGVKIDAIPLQPLIFHALLTFGSSQAQRASKTDQEGSLFAKMLTSQGSQAGRLVTEGPLAGLLGLWPRMRAGVVATSLHVAVIVFKPLNKYNNDNPPGWRLFQIMEARNPQMQ
jgi:hypothetical protein